MKPLIVISKGVRPLRNGNKSAKEYPFWEQLIELLEKEYEVVEVVKLPLDELAGLLKEAKYIVCCDSFLQHFCWDIGVRAIVLWGVGDPLIFGHQENINLLKSRNNLRPNQFDTWEGVACSNDIWVSPEEVLAVLKQQ
jgi:ADP-heptose:LPS heptosyltransferase